MRVVQINAVNRFSSTGANTWELHNFLLEQGYESFIFCTNEHDPQKGIYKIGNSLDQKLHSLLSHTFGNQGAYSHQATQQLVDRLEKIKPDIVHLGNLHSNFINLKILLEYLAAKNISTTLTLHDCWFFTGHCCYFTDTNCDNWKTGCGNCPDLKNWNSSWLFDHSRENLRQKAELFGKISKLGVIGVSKWVTDFIHDSVLKNAKIIRTVYNWINTDVFKPQDTDILRLKLNLKADDFVILGVAQTWSNQKGLDAFINLAKMMPSYKFVMVGNMDPSIDLPVNIIKTGVASNAKELSQYYSLADVFFMPSTRETFGKVTAEALCCGAPVVAYNVTATPELIPDDCGFVIEQGDLNAAKNCIQIIKSNGKRCYRDKCRNYAEATFDKKMLMNKYIDIFKELQ